MTVTIILSILLGAYLIYNLIKMVNNVRNGRSIDGCNGDCSHCSGGCSSAPKTGNIKDKFKRKK